MEVYERVLAASPPPEYPSWKVAYFYYRGYLIGQNPEVEKYPQLLHTRCKTFANETWETFRKENPNQ